MAENTITDPAENNGNQGTGNEPAKTFTQDDINKIAAKEAKSGEKKGFATGIEQGKAEARTAMLAEMGFDNEESYTAYLEAKKNKETDSDRLKAANSTIESLKKELDTANKDHAAIRQKLSGYEERDILGDMGLTDVKKQKLYAPAIRESVAENESFADAVERFKKDNPELFEEKQEKQQPPPGALWGGPKQKTPAGASKNLTQALFGGK